jgi:hexosaminidase
MSTARRTVIRLLAPLVSLCFAPHPSWSVQQGDVSIVPRPLSAQVGPGAFTLTAKTRILYPPADTALRHIAEYLAVRLQPATAFTPALAPAPKGAVSNAIVLSRTTGGPAEGYRLTVTKSSILCEGNDPGGTFYAVQTLLQLLPPAIFQKSPAAGIRWEVPAVRIEDQPRYGWRGGMLDVARHFFPKEFVKEFIDYLALHKMNVFHWHLNDDQGWRLESKKYPSLTTVSAWRADRENLHWNARPPQLPGEIPTYGGFYTQEEVREVLAYAAERFITVVPEIEMPAHAMAVLAAFPELSCTGGPFTVPTGSVWPITDIYCAGNDSTFRFLESLLDEIITLFPSRFVHIGGDEAHKKEWKRCPKCQARIASEKLKDEDELQSYFIRRIERHLSGRGKRLIGWDEILEGGLAPGATVMSWRGFDGGIKAAKSGHDVVMSPTSHCYFDYYQGDWRLEPVAIGGFLPLKTVYSYEPTPAELSPEEARHILGAQANLWTEFIGTPEKAQYMIFPRLAAMAEVTWSAKELRDWASFVRRLPRQMKRYAAMGVTVARSAYTVTPKDSFDVGSWSRILTLEAEIGADAIRYARGTKAPGPSSPIYARPLVLAKPEILTAAVFEGQKPAAPPTTIQARINRRGITVRSLEPSLDLLRNGSGPAALVDNLQAAGGQEDTRWQGIRGKDVDVVIDLGASRPVRSVSAGFYHSSRDLIFLPSAAQLLVSDDAVTFRSAASVLSAFPMTTDRPARREIVIPADGTKARYVRLRMTNAGPAGEWHKLAGQPTWIYLDEITVE